MKSSVRWTGIVLSMTTLAFTVAAKADVSVDLTTGVPGYWSVDGYFVSGSVPDGYQQSASSNQLIITALPNLTEAQSSPSNVNNRFQIGLTGDFSATVTASVAYSGLLHSGSGGFGINNGSNGLWAEINTTYDYVDSWHGIPGGARVGTPHVPHDATSVQLNLERTGQNLNLSYAFGDGTFSTAQTLTGQNVLGVMDFYLFGWGPPNDPAATQITFSDFTYTSAPATISGMAGGTASNPTDLSAATVGAIYGTIGDTGHVADFFTFYWGGAATSARTSAFPARRT